MSHHFDQQPESQDITDAYCFDGASDDDGPRTIFGMNVSPYNQPKLPPEAAGDQGLDPATFYELRLDLDGDFIEETTWRFTFPKDSTGTQYVQVAQLRGADATSRTAPARSSRPDLQYNQAVPLAELAGRPDTILPSVLRYTPGNSSTTSLTSPHRHRRPDRLNRP